MFLSCFSFLCKLIFMAFHGWYSVTELGRQNRSVRHVGNVRVPQFKPQNMFSAYTYIGIYICHNLRRALTASRVAFYAYI